MTIHQVLSIFVATVYSDEWTFTSWQHITCSNQQDCEINKHYINKFNNKKYSDNIKTDCEKESVSFIREKKLLWIKPKFVKGKQIVIKNMQIGSGAKILWLRKLQFYKEKYKWLGEKNKD